MKGAPLLIILGAGASVDSGLRTYRGTAESLYDNRSIPEERDLTSSEEDRLEVFRTFHPLYADIAANKPGPTYDMLKQLIGDRPCCIVTQNIDGYAVEVLGPDVIEVHGTAKHCRCMKCGQECETPQVMFERDAELKTEHLQCLICRGPLRPQVILLGGMVDTQAVSRFIKRRHPRDVLVVGTSLQFPYLRRLINKAKCRGARVCHVNPDENYRANKNGELLFKTLEEYMAF